MQCKHNQVRRGDGAVAERAIILQLLRDDHPRAWSAGELERELMDLDPATITAAIARLARDGVVSITGEAIAASTVARRLDELEMISV